ncbi:MAG: hypothetical protein MJ149_02835 [Clostridia bacterium]|nr:hypothetical protein [Clostridia bacterium]
MKDICDKIYNRSTTELLVYLHDFLRNLFDNGYVDSTSTQNMVKVVLEFALRQNNIDTSYCPVKIRFLDEIKIDGKDGFGACVAPHIRNFVEHAYDIKHKNKDQDLKRFAHKSKQKFADEFENYVKPNPNKLQMPHHLWFEICLNKKDATCNFDKLDKDKDVHNALAPYILFLQTISHEVQHVVQYVLMANKIDIYGSENNTYDFNYIADELFKYDGTPNTNVILGKGFNDILDVLKAYNLLEANLKSYSKQENKEVKHKTNLISKMVDFVRFCQPLERDADLNGCYYLDIIFDAAVAIDNEIHTNNAAFIEFLTSAKKFYHEENMLRKIDYKNTKKNITK